MAFKIVILDMDFDFDFHFHLDIFIVINQNTCIVMRLATVSHSMSFLRSIYFEYDINQNDCFLNIGYK